MSSTVLTVLLLVGIGLMVLAGRIRRRGERQPRPSAARGIRGRYGTGGEASVAELERDRIQRERSPRGQDEDGGASGR